MIYILVKHKTFQGKDISDKKIYWDTEKKQFRHRIHCIECGSLVMCMCYDTAHQAMIDSEHGMVCNYCYVIDKIFSDDIGEEVIKELPTELGIAELFEAFEASEEEDKNIAKEIEARVRQIDESEIQDIANEINDEWDFVITGSECEL